MLFFYSKEDKFIIGSSILLYGFIFVIMISFFHIINFSYNKNTGYFIYYYYRTNHSLLYLSFNIGLRSIMQGVAHSLLQNNYPAMICLLVCVELTLVLWTIFTEIKHKICIKRTIWAFKVIYNFCFALLNLSLLSYYYWT